MRSESTWLIACVPVSIAVSGSGQLSGQAFQRHSPKCRAPVQAVTAHFLIIFSDDLVRLFSVLVLAGLVGNTTAGLAGALAGGLALAAAAADSALCHVACIKCHDVLHDNVLSKINYVIQVCLTSDLVPLYEYHT